MERKFTKGLSRPGMAAQLRENVSQAVKETTIQVRAMTAVKETTIQVRAMTAVKETTIQVRAMTAIKEVMARNFWYSKIRYIIRYQ